MVFPWSQSNNTSPLVSRTLLSILADFNNALIFMIFFRTPISNSSSFLFEPLMTVQGTPIKISITVTLMFHSLFVFFYFSGKVLVLVSLFVFFDFHFVVRRDGKVHSTASSLFLFCLFVNCYYAYYFLDLQTNRFIGLVDRVFANGPRDLNSILGRVIPKTFKMVLDTS